MTSFRFFRLVLISLLLVVAGCSSGSVALGVSGSLSSLAATTTTTTTTTVAEATALRNISIKQEPFTLEQLVNRYFAAEDRAWALQVVWCESRSEPDSIGNTDINKASGASGWFQHLPKFWEERTIAAGIPGANILDPIAQMTVAAYLLYETPQGSGHWYPSEHCWR